LNSTDLCFLPAEELAAAIRKKNISPREAVEAVLGPIEAINP